MGRSTGEMYSRRGRLARLPSRARRPRRAVSTTSAAPGGTSFSATIRAATSVAWPAARHDDLDRVTWITLPKAVPHTEASAANRRKGILTLLLGGREAGM